ncbi:MAG TPA: glycoside hydrolase family 15 protein, partial [Gemmatimonadaceae bacterium]|nr:glycoside hydrolase family 15 protein [Gemmatimonadaceae bacterium]
MPVKSNRIEDYALIGDCETAALISLDGSIDWLCWPRFDSAACFAALLGGPDQGRWRIAPKQDGARTRRSYRGDSLVLETEIETSDGCAKLIDFMPLRDGESNIVRTVIGVRGAVEMMTELILRFDYGSTVPWMTRFDDGALRAIAGPDMVVIRSDVELHGEGFTTVGEFTVREGQRCSFVMTRSASNLDPPTAVDPVKALEVTEQYWADWAAQCTYRGAWREAVMRSLLTLKALTYAPTGGIVAAATTSLPENLGGVRNWDYRYCWLRDATLSLLALMHAGYYNEAEDWRNWLLRAAAGRPDQAQIMYGVGGERMLPEWEIAWLPGYESSKPVRVGNAAHEQMQLDVFGDVMSALHQARLGGMPENDDVWQLQKAFADHVAACWREPDHGLWEVRGKPQNFTHSKVMAWVAMDRALQSAERLNLDGALDHWREARDAIHADVCEKGFDKTLNAFVQSYESPLPDASLLLLPIVRFLPATDSRILSTVALIEERLLRDGLVLRYESEKTDDGLPAGEGAFLACSFWLAQNYEMQGRHDDARRLFEYLLSLRNDVGLLAEQYDARLHRQVGNFPQAFSH